MRNLSFSKKGQVSSLAPAILALVFAGIILVFGIIMSQNITDTQKGTTLVTVTTNQTLAITGTASSALISQSSTCGYTSWNATRLMNCTTCAIPTNNTLVEGTNYIINANGSISNKSFVGTPLVVSGLTYYYGGEACETGNKTTIGLGKFADFWEIIVLAIVITVVIGLLLVVFGGSRNR